MKRRLPLGIQDFAKLREGGFVYVDKTGHIYSLITGPAGPVFLSRPRRFGKSLLCSTLAAIFEGRRELFSGLAIDTTDWQWKKYPVIKLDLNPGNYTEGTDILNVMLQNNLEIAASKMNLNLHGTVLPQIFINLIIDAKNKFNERLTILIDEYDKPLLTTIDNPELYITMQNILKGFYSVLKSADEYLGFVLITGVTKFSQIGVFSDLNNLTDISLNPDYYDICGFTQEELETNFEPEINSIVIGNAADGYIADGCVADGCVAANPDQSSQEYMNRLKHFYNGYRFSEKPATVYNPYGLLNHFFNRGKFGSYWYSTATPTFLIKLIAEQKIDILDLERKTVTICDFQKFNIDKMDVLPVLYQTGYLTISGYNQEAETFTLDYPNEEVRASFADSLLEHYTKAENNEAYTCAQKINISLIKGHVEDALNALRSLFAAIPYDIQIKQEKYYQTIVYLTFRMFGLNCQSELRTADGRIDVLVETQKYVYCFEFKLNGTADEALQQIDSREYLLQWKGSGKKLFKVGINFDFEKRNIGEWKTANENK
ncbi:MAG: ATP-binding protein [Treponema sp.]|jgi:hypothetical protein|nr:ATP-binding protein [Treponema sp.]